jgi:hypothetical protein
MDPMKKNSPIPVRSADTEIIIKLLEDLKPGELITYEDISKAIGRNILDCRGILYTAIKAILREGDVIQAVRGVGVKKAQTDEILSEGDRAQRRIRKTARRGIQRVACAKDLTRAQLQRRDFNQSMLGVFYALTERGVKRRIEARATTQGEIPPAKMLEVFKKEEK